ncbi:hypothetical protein MMC06_006155 [Schaereria dolodes]|nr:hypothetical protein [Schaereria dolodes]
MGGPSSSTPAAPSQLTVPRALEIARNTDSNDIHPAVQSILQRAIGEIWRRIQAQPNSYIMSKDEFAVFNYYRGNFSQSDVAQRAVGRFWNHFQGNASDVDGFES